MAKRETVLRNIATKLVELDWRLAVAESCTGGGLAKCCTELAGSSNWFDCGVVTYSNQAKQTLLGVSTESLDRYGAVSEAVASEMVKGLFRLSEAELALSITGIAGPTGGSKEKPVGTVWFGWGVRGKSPCTECVRFSGDRSVVREQAVDWALSRLDRLLED